MAGESAREVARRAREKAERLRLHAEMYERGADGEVKTAGVLAILGAGWTTLHDVKWPGRRFANIDHIVVGPSGIFVIDSKNWSGEITVDGALRQNGRSRETAVSGCADAALAVGELAGPFASVVFPVLCFVRDEPLTGWARDVILCSTGNLSQMLYSRPTLLTPQQVTDAAMRLDAQLRSAAGADEPPDRVSRRQAGRPSRAGSISSRASSGRVRPGPARRSKPRKTSGSRPRSKTPSLGGLVAAIAMMIGFVAYGPQVLVAVGEAVSQQITSTVEDNTEVGRSR